MGDGYGRYHQINGLLVGVSDALPLLPPSAPALCTCNGGGGP